MQIEKEMRDRSAKSDGRLGGLRPLSFQSTNETLDVFDDIRQAISDSMPSIGTAK